MFRAYRPLLCLFVFGCFGAAATAEIEGTFPAEGGPITIRAIDGPVNTQGIQLIVEEGTITGGNDPAPFRFFVKGKNKQEKEIILGTLGQDAVIDDEVALDVIASADAVIKATYALGNQPVPFEVKVDGPKVPDEVAALWATFSKLSEKPTAKLSEDELVERIYHCRDLISGAKTDQILYLAEQFGLHDDDDADLNLAFALGEYFLPARQPNPDKTVNEIQNSVAKRLCKRFLSDEQSLARYYHFSLWTGKFLNRFQPQVSMENMKAKAEQAINETSNPKDYWWHARNGLLLMHATGAVGDLADTSLLANAFNRWHENVEGKSLSIDSESPLFWKIKESDSVGGQKIKLPKKPFTYWTGELSPAYFVESLNEPRKAKPTK